MSDAALLSHALLRWDEGALGRIVGDFAFALWDGAARRLLLARDFAGQRPLHYHADDGIFAFASMPKGLHALRQVPRAPDPDAAADFLAHLPESDGASFFQGISKIPPGHFAVATSAGVTTHRYWHPPARKRCGSRARTITPRRSVRISTPRWRRGCAGRRAASRRI